MIPSINRIRAIVRNYPVKISVRLQHELTKNKDQKPPPKAAVDVVNYIENSPEYADVKDRLPRSLLRKYKTPESMYLINKSTAKVIAQTVKKHLNEHSPIVEVNPGLGLLSIELLHCQKKQLYMYETSNHFTQYLNSLQLEHPGRVKLKIADFFGMWKLAFQDKIDQGNRIEELLGDLATDDPEREVKIVGSMPGLSFMKHLINNIVFHNTTSQLGRPDLFITMPGHHYEFLTDSEIQLSKHMSVPTLFQLLFDYKILTNVPKIHFLPWTHPATNKRVTMMDEYQLYLVNITQKKDLPVPPEYLSLLWYFFKPHMFSKSTRVIPMLELISWPEFEQCQFRVSMENNLPKFVTAVDEDVKTSIDAHIDDVESSDSDSENS
ncbi:mitochondrial transcription factor B2 isoform X2 [Choristoneura fumiferana]|uniref:mitochondrial transcription factor B2 isoform X2 n=1 Tax=Choristoneura fumiferana TaxID=7141 RepID=UPI003D1537E6